MTTPGAPEEVELYFDYKSPFAFLAMQPAFDLERRHGVEVRWIPFLLRIKGKGERSVYSERKVRYSYMDALASRSSSTAESSSGVTTGSRCSRNGSRKAEGCVRRLPAARPRG